MFKMPETPSSVRTRATVFHDAPESAPHATSSIARSMSREMLISASTVRSFNEREEFRDSCSSANNQLAVRSFELSEDPSFWKDHNVQVIIRLRPLNSSEISTQGYGRCVRQDSSQTITWTGHPESRFTFDVVADETVSQEKLFKVTGVPMVDNCVAGYNSCMFAYGQTGSGKTHTMLGDIEGGTRRHSVNSGMTPRVFEYLFTRIQKEKEARREEKFRFTCKCSFLEIYNEQILDLLNPSSLNLQIREDLKKGIYVENLTELEVTSARDVMQQLLEGATNRKVAATNMNRASSRSHSVFTCVIESTWESQGVTHHRFARLNLVDLAGSERQKSSGAEGERLKEATNINKSLSTLGLVIMNLVSISNGKNLHVPYRDSKLTFLLQDSLGGNSKTTIIANISPSSSCSLETLSTLKFAQRAKFIKNNATINEDASGDVLAMRMQIQQLKKEVAQLRGQQNGGSGNHDSETYSMSLLGSPGAFKWEGLGVFSPQASNKKLSQKKEFEVALVGAFRREKDKDQALEALTAENKAAMQLAKHREDEIQGLKMRLRFREAGIKRLEAVAAGKISAEAHLLKEKEELLREIHVLRGQVDRNQEVTRFAMENLHLKEEIRRLKSFCEEGERERMSEQIIALQNKLLEALDWKLMHETDPSRVQKGSPLLLTDGEGDPEQLISNKESASPSISLVKEENEFLRLQAIQNQAEIDSLQKKLDSCLLEKEKLERQTKDLETDLEELRTVKDAKEAQTMETKAPSNITNDTGIMPVNDQLELKAMVDAIAAASHREAEAHEMAVNLAKENEELRAKIKVLIEDNSELIDLYEKAAAEQNAKDSSSDTQEKNSELIDLHEKATTENNDKPRSSGTQEMNNEAQYSESDAISQMKSAELERMQELEHQLTDMHDENEKLMSLYEKAMQERDDLKRLLSCALHDSAADKGESECAEKLVEVDEGGHSQSSESTDENTDMEVDTLHESSIHCPSTPFAEVDDMDLESNDPSSTMKNTNMEEVLPNAEAGVLREGGNLGCNMEVRSGQCLSTNGDVATNTSMESNEHQHIMEACPTIKSRLESCYEHSASESPEKSYVSTCMANGKDSGDSQNAEDTSANEGTCPESTINGEFLLLKAELEKAREKLSSSAHVISEFRVLENAVLQIDDLSSEIEAVKDLVQCKHKEIESLKALSSDSQARRCLIENKLAAVRVSVSSIYSSTAYFEQREVRAKARVDTSVSSLNRKKESLLRLHIQSDVINARKREIQVAEAELRNNLSCLKAKLDELNQRQESERVLMSIDNIERNEITAVQNRLKSGSKATELLKSEEEKTKLQNEIKQSREKLGVMKQNVEDLNMKAQKHNSEIQLIGLEMEKAAKTVEEAELALQNVMNEKEALMELLENGRTEIETLTAEYHLCVYDDCVTEEELIILAEDIRMMSAELDKLNSDRSRIVKSAAKLFHRSDCHTVLPSEKMQQELEDVQNLIEEASISLSRNLH